MQQHGDAEGARPQPQETDGDPEFRGAEGDEDDRDEEDRRSDDAAGQAGQPADGDQRRDDDPERQSVVSFGIRLPRAGFPGGASLPAASFCVAPAHGFWNG